MIRHKTDILTVMLCGNWKSNLLCDLADMWLIIIAHRHKRMGKLLLRQIVKCIGLILCRCDGITDRVTPVCKLHDACIMPGGNIIRTDLQ